MDGIVTLGPVAFAADRLLAVVLIAGFVFAMDWVATRSETSVTRVTGLVLVTGIIAARLAYVIVHRDAFAKDWWSAFAFWQGGFVAWAGFLAAAAVIGWRMRPRAAAMRALALLALLGISWFAGAAILAPEARPLPDLPPLVRLDGSAIAPEALAGSPVVINLWATWCPPCRRELPMLVAEAEATNVPVLLVNQGESPDIVRDYLAANNIESSAIALDRQSALSARLDAAALPTTLFVNASGDVVETHVGEISRAALVARIAEFEGEMK